MFLFRNVVISEQEPIYQHAKRHIKKMNSKSEFCLSGHFFPPTYINEDYSSINFWDVELLDSKLHLYKIYLRTWIRLKILV